MLKFRFRKKELRRRSNSCPNLDTCTGQQRDVDVNRLKHSSVVQYNVDGESETEEEVPSPSRRERLHALKSIRRVKKKEKEQQENNEKNLISTDDFWKKIDSLKEWLNEEGKGEVDQMQSPKLRSYFKHFMRLWNKRKLPLKYYRSCCVDGEEASSSAENQSIPQTPGKSQGHNTFDFTAHSTLRDLPSYHKFPLIDEPSDQEILSVFSSPVAFQADTDDVKDGTSPFATFGKSPWDPHTSTSVLAKQVNSQPSPNGSTSVKTKTGSPKKFATISRSAPASSLFKSDNSSSPQLHAVFSPTCPHPTHFDFPPSNTENSSLAHSSDGNDSAKRPSPAYVSVKDAIPFACNSPKYSQLEFDSSVFDGDDETDYCSLSSFLVGKESPSIGGHGKKVSRKPSNLSRRRSKSMEDIYAVPSRLFLMNMEIGKDSTCHPVKEEIWLKTPPVPKKQFTPTPSMADLGVGRNDSFPISKVEKNETLISASDLSSVNSTSTDLGYQSLKREGSLRNSCLTSSFLSSVKSPLSYQRQSEKVGGGVKRKSEEHEVLAADFESPKKTKSTLDDNDESVTSWTDTEFTNSEYDLSIADFLKDPPSRSQGGKKSQKNVCLPKENSKLSILTGSMKPTVRTPKKDSKEKDETRLSILQIKVLDSSPKLPRRRPKRRSSSLTVTPGKGLTFGNKNSRLAVSSPRRVSFAKSVKEGDEKAAMTQRQKSALSKTLPVKSGMTARDISRQSQDKAEFESFWHRQHQSPGNSSPAASKPKKPWSPSKWLSPTKENAFAISTTTTTTTASTTTTLTDRIINEESSSPSSNKVKESNLNIPGNQKKPSTSPIKLLSPKKLFSSKHKTSTSSLMAALEGGKNNTDTESSTLSNNGDMMSLSSTGVASPVKPKSILKGKDATRSPVTPSTDLTESFLTTGEKQSASLNLIEKEKSSLSRNFHLSGLQQNHFANRPKIPDWNLCRSPTKLGVASLKAVQHSFPTPYDLLPPYPTTNWPAPESSGCSKQSKGDAAGDLSTTRTEPPRINQPKETRFSISNREEYSDEYIGRLGEDTLGKAYDCGSSSSNSLGLAKPFGSFFTERYEQNGGFCKQEGFRIQTNGSIAKTLNATQNKLGTSKETTFCGTGVSTSTTGIEIGGFPDPGRNSCVKSVGDDEWEGSKQVESVNRFNGDNDYVVAAPYPYSDNADTNTSCIDDIYSLATPVDGVQIDNPLTCTDEQKRKDELADNLYLLRQPRNDVFGDEIYHSPKPEHLYNSPESEHLYHSPKSDHHYHSPKKEHLYHSLETEHDIHPYDQVQQVDTNLHPSAVGDSTSSQPPTGEKGEEDEAFVVVSEDSNFYPVPISTTTGCYGDTWSIKEEEGNNEIASNVIERMKSFRASPKVEENDGWITERRRSKGSSKKKSFRSAHNRYLLQAGSQEVSEIDFSNVEGMENCNEGPDVDVSNASTSLIPRIDQEQREETSVPVVEEDDPHISGALDGGESVSFHPEEKSRDVVREDVLVEDCDLDNGYETESRGKDKKCSGEAETESVSSVTSADSGHEKSDSSGTIYDVPRNGIHHFSPGDSHKLPAMNRKDSVSENSIYNNKQPVPFGSPGGVDNSHFVDPAISMCEQPGGNEVEGNDRFKQEEVKKTKNINDEQRDGGMNKENVETEEPDTIKIPTKITVCPTRPLKSRPSVKPKPPSRSASTLISTHSPKASSTKGYTGPQTKARRRSSIAKKESFSTGEHQAGLSSPGSENDDNNITITTSKSTRLVVRKRSSMGRGKDDLRRKSFKNSPSSSSMSPARATQHNERDEKRDSLTPRRKRVSVEKGTRRSSGVSGPEQTSFAQRRKFFQQLQVSSGDSSSGSPSSSSPSSVSRPLRSSNSILSKSKPQPKPKPVVAPKPNNCPV